MEFFGSYFDIVMFTWLSGALLLFVLAVLFAPDETEVGWAALFCLAWPLVAVIGLPAVVIWLLWAAIERRNLENK